MASSRGEEDTVLVDDISRGLEKITIPLVYRKSRHVPKLPKFTYIKNNTVFNAAHVDFALARISVNCDKCNKDCLSAALPCQCSAETRGEFAYTPEGLLKEKFLNDNIAMLAERDERYYHYCDCCPLQPEGGKCEGHLSRKFIKECWVRCGCGKSCGNRVVQNGISVNLQVFLTPQGKGWGVRTLQVLKKGTFVCEYAGEIVTNEELYQRNKIYETKNARHTYPVYLDGDWGSEKLLKDEEALCLDATTYGNVGRFINHRCNDANLIEIPVELETPDHHYYHLAFFTSRDVEALEELTWDYAIRFDDHFHPVKAFKCLCGSELCRAKRSSKVRR